MSQLKFWNKQNNNSKTDNSENTENKNGTTTKEETKGGKRNWLHTPEALINGHVVYLVKFSGSLPVDQPKGIEVVKDTIRKLQFAQQMKKAETGTQEKFKKVEITISVDGVAVQEPRTQKILHQFPLHNISYCADDKGVKKYFSFIAKTVKTNSENMTNGRGSSPDGSTQSSSEETHECFVFISNKLASDITLTIGQAFELAFRKYINTAEKSELSKAQQQITDLEKIITIYKNRLRELALKIPKNEMDTYLFREGIKDIVEVPVSTTQSITAGDSTNSSALTNGTNGLSDNNNDRALLIDTNSCNTSSKMSTTSSASSTSFLPAVPPRNSMPTQLLTKNNNQKMDELLLNSDSDSDFDPRAEESNTDGNSTGSGGKTMTNDLFGFEPSKSFGQQLFYNNNDNKFINNNNTSIISNNSNNSFSELTITPPLLAPPPKVSASRRSTSVTTPTAAMTNNNHNIISNGNMADLFGSDPFDTAVTTNGTSIFQKQVSKMSVDDFTLESLDPLK
ncbi:PTB domain-containing adapter protein ced-6 [Lucilia cuprina]|uniref:PTB domain-containing adapter protein ced-6 n=1 Tax=Lucilia cuprina TaxID=7375 RepID=A0A0L0CAI4_LUCCU|nr:PTB domain-containing adapter protein ced-6 [Lucilia cuprina]KAI8119119.1 PTB domain-containing adapter protein ced-6 [Lucilia cuprina]KNC29266.1 PTB domain-containing adapter protein ced-6 [Lucilia cuprina]